jgi:hypothetical protein
MPNQYEDKELNSQLDNLFSWHIDGEKVPVLFRPELKEGIKQLITQKQLEARIKELEMMQGGDVAFHRYAEQRIAKLTKQEGK